MELAHYNDRSMSFDYNPSNKTARAFYFAAGKQDQKKKPLHALKKMESEKFMDTGLIMSDAEEELKIQEYTQYTPRDLISIGDEIQEELLAFLKELFLKLRLFVTKNENFQELLSLLVESEESRRFFTTLPIITSTRFIDIIESVNQNIEFKIGKIKKEMETIKGQKNDNFQHYQQNLLKTQ